MLGRRGLIGGAAAVGLAATRARAQGGGGGFPDRPLRWIVGYPPGGASDVFARLIGGQMSARLGQPVVVENRPGGGAIGRFPLFVVVRPDNLAPDFAALVEASKRRAPNYGTPAVASPHHLAM